jgi:4'-phosphopantetheinyl transferase EntD
VTAPGAFAALLPEDVAWSDWTPERAEPGLHREEAHVVARCAARRRRDFAAGRRCARDALAQLGVDAFPLLAGPRREPLWPVGIVGSISHTDGYCAAAVARQSAIRGIGIDVERADPLPARLLRTVASPAERAALTALGRGRVAWGKVLFSAKESVFKCYYPAAHLYLDFSDVSVAIRPERGAFVARLREPHAAILGCERLAGSFAASLDHVFTAVVLRGPRGGTEEHDRCREPDR